MKYFVYKITNKIDGKSYIGVSRKPQRRFEQHISGITFGEYRPKSLIHLAIKEYGKDNFCFDVIFGAKSRQNIAEIEFNLIKEYNAIYPDGYNVRNFSTLSKNGAEAYKCSVAECISDIYCKGFCVKHYQRNLTYGDISINKKPGGICEVAGCGLKRAAIKPSYCTKHWTRWKRHGDPMIVKVPRDIAAAQQPQWKELRGIWAGMHSRCYNNKHEQYRNYGGRGIFVCEKWHTFENFYLDMYPRPKGHTLDRIKNNNKYSPDNCCWSTPEKQGQNRRDNVLDLNLARHIKIMLKWDFPVTSISEYWDVPSSAIYNIRAGKSWRNA